MCEGVMTVLCSPTIQFEFAQSYESCDSKDAGKSQRHHEYCCEHVSFTCLNASHAICGYPQSTGSDVPSCHAIVPPACMAYYFTVEDHRSKISISSPSNMVSRILPGSFSTTT